MAQTDQKEEEPVRNAELLAQIGELNRDIEALIRGAVEGSFARSDWSSLAERFEPVRCREINDCRKQDCPAFDNADHRCWLTVGTFCGGCIQGEFAKKYKTCFECAVFRKISDQPIRRLYENINTLVSFLRDKAAKLQVLALRDPLTGLYNRHFFNEVIDQITAQNDRCVEDFSFIMIVLDNFKQINDELGHLAGDGILMEAARLIVAAVRKADLVFRFGGDEFLIMMSGADAVSSMSMMDRLQAAVAEWNRNAADAFCCEMSFSTGSSTRTSNGDIHAALKEADELMYRHKGEKRSLSGR